MNFLTKIRVIVKIFAKRFHVLSKRWRNRLSEMLNVVPFRPRHEGSVDELAPPLGL